MKLDENHNMSCINKVLFVLFNINKNESWFKK